MKEQTISIQANLCYACGEVWFTQYFKVEGEQTTCPYCNVTIKTFSKHYDLEHIDSNTTVDADKSIPDEISKLMDRKTSEPLVKKICTFCKNDLYVAGEDSKKQLKCPICSAEVSDVTSESGNAEPNPDGELEVDTSLSGLMFVPVIIRLKDKRHTLTKWFTKPQPPVHGIFMGYHPEISMVRVMDIKRKETLWLKLEDIDGITEVLEENFENIKDKFI